MANQISRTVQFSLKSEPLVSVSSKLTPKRTAATLATFQIPNVTNEPNKHFTKGSLDRKVLQDTIRSQQRQAPIEVPLIIDGSNVKSSTISTQTNPSDHQTVIAKYTKASSSDVKAAIDQALAVRKSWSETPFADRAAIFLKAADLLSTKYRYDVMAATMLGQGKNAWQAEIDAAAELIDFFRFNVKYAQDLYAQQPPFNSTGVWNRIEYRPLEGFVYAVSPFNFTAIGGNLSGAPALMGNVVIWKPSDSSIASNYLVFNILREAGLPEGVIQFIPGDPEEVTKVVLDHPEFAALHYTGSTAVFRSLYGKIGTGIASARYKSYPRIVGETGGKNFHVVHKSADVSNAVYQTIRAAFEYQGQKCSACSRAYIPASRAEEFKSLLKVETEKLKIGPVEEMSNFIGPVIHARSFEKLSGVIDGAKGDEDLTLLTGGIYNASKGWFVTPTVYETRNPSHPNMKTEFFGPILHLYVYDDSKPDAFFEVCKLADTTGDYALTGAVFAQERSAIREAEEALRNSAGNFYINGKCTGAVVGQQPFGGARASGTNDKAGSFAILSRFVSMRSIKEDLLPIDGVAYPSNQMDGLE